MSAYQEMPTPVRRLFKHTHLNTACRLLGVSSLSLEYLPEIDPSTAAAETEAEAANGGEEPKGWAAGPSKNRFAPGFAAFGEGLVAAQLDAPSGVADKGYARESWRPAGRKVGAGEGGAATAAAGGELPFAVMRGPDVEQERWEVRCLGVFALKFFSYTCIHVCFSSGTVLEYKFVLVLRGSLLYII